jgi:hypothetical protein
MHVIVSLSLHVIVTLSLHVIVMVCHSNSLSACHSALTTGSYTWRHNSVIYYIVNSVDEKLTV